MTEKLERIVAARLSDDGFVDSAVEAKKRENTFSARFSRDKNVSNSRVQHPHHVYVRVIIRTGSTMTIASAHGDDMSYRMAMEK